MRSMNILASFPSLLKTDIAACPIYTVCLPMKRMELQNVSDFFVKTERKIFVFITKMTPQVTD